MSPLRKSLAAGALLVATSPAAHAYEFSTPVSQSLDGAAITCAILNVGTTPAVVSAGVKSMLDGSDMTVIDTCPPSPGTLPPGVACIAYTSQSGVHSGYCHFTASTTKVRANLIVFDTNGKILTTSTATR